MRTASGSKRQRGMAIKVHRRAVDGRMAGRTDGRTDLVLEVFGAAARAPELVAPDGGDLGPWG